MKDCQWQRGVINRSMKKSSLSQSITDDIFPRSLPFVTSKIVRNEWKKSNCTKKKRKTSGTDTAHSASLDFLQMCSKYRNSSCSSLISSRTPIDSSNSSCPRSFSIFDLFSFCFRLFLNISSMHNDDEKLQRLELTAMIVKIYTLIAELCVKIREVTWRRWTKIDVHRVLDESFDTMFISFGQTKILLSYPNAVSSDDSVCLAIFSCFFYLGTSFSSIN